MNEHVLLFSHLDAEIFAPSQCEQFLPKLLVATLLQKEVLLLAADVTTNRLLAEYLCQNPDKWALVEDLIRNSNAIILVIHPIGEYPPECEFDPLLEPVQTWAWMVKHTRLFGSEEFRPSAIQKTFYRKIDSAFRGTNRVRPSSGTPDAGNSFAFYFREVLTARFAELKQLDDYALLSPATAQLYREFASDDRAWKSALAAKGQLPSTLEQTRFYRSAAYRCLRLFSMTDEESTAWKSLFQSVFYSNLCMQLGVMGRFGGRLHDLPLDFSVA